MNFFLKILVTAVNVFILASLLPGIHVHSFFTALLVAIVLSLLDYVVKPVLIILTLPATVFTLGLFLFVINAFIILIDAHFVGGFQVDGFSYALLFSICLSIINAVVYKMVRKNNTKTDS
jgi:putative membrane protein